MTVIEPLTDSFTNLTKVINQAPARVALANNGMTPSRGLIAESTKYANEQQKSIDVCVNANADSSHYNDSEIKIMEDDLFQCQELGVDGVIIGATNDQHQIDQEAMKILIGAADGMEMFFSPAFDNIYEKNWDSSIQWLVENDFSGIVATKKLAKLQSTLKKDNQLRFTPLSENKEQLKEAEDLNPLIIIAKK